VLNLCVRALDYCPPVDVNFGDYLRAIITSDVDLVPDDDLGYRIAVVEAFRRRGIYPRDVRTLSVESLRWPSTERVEGFFGPLADWLRREMAKFVYYESRERIYEETERLAAALHEWIADEGHHALTRLGKDAGIRFDLGLEGLRPDDRRPGVPTFQVHALRPARRVGPDGDSLNQLIISIIQSRDITVEPPDAKAFEFKFRGGCTFILDLDSMRLRYAIAKDIGDPDRLDRQKQYRTGLVTEGSPAATYFRHFRADDEPLALLHRKVDYGRP
jgi:hypothetical protein